MNIASAWLIWILTRIGSNNQEIENTKSMIVCYNLHWEMSWLMREPYIFSKHLRMTTDGSSTKIYRLEIHYWTFLNETIFLYSRDWCNLSTAALCNATCVRHSTSKKLPNLSSPHYARQLSTKTATKLPGFPTTMIHTNIPVPGRIIIRYRYAANKCKVPMH